MRGNTDNVVENVKELYLQGKSFYDAGDFASAFDCFSKAAEAGNIDAIVSLGYMYFDGDGVDQDFAQAFTWYKKAAELEDSEAQLNLGCMYILGKGVKQDDAKALFWLQKSADAENSEAQNMLGSTYFDEQNYAEALSWYRKAAEAGSADAQFNLSDMYEYGKGVEQDIDQAHFWCQKAAEAGHTEAQRKCDLFAAHHNGKNDKKSLSAREELENLTLSELKEMADELGIDATGSKSVLVEKLVGWVAHSEEEKPKKTGKKSAGKAM